MTQCYIGVGSNVGDRGYYIRAAVHKVKRLRMTKVTAMSPVIETTPVGGPAQGPYLNAVMAIETELGPYALLSELQRIESELGRVRVIANGPRTIDLDILTFGEFCVDEAGLCIPHPRILTREFVVRPLRAIAPQAVAMIRRLLQKKPGNKRAGRRSR